MIIPNNLREFVLLFLDGETGGVSNWKTDELTWIDTVHSDGVMIFESQAMIQLTQNHAKLKDDYTRLLELCKEMGSDLNVIATTPPHATHLAVVMNKTAKKSLAKYEQFMKEEG